MSVGSRGSPIMYFDENGDGPNYHVCDVLSAVQSWLDRQILIGGVDAAERACVERMIVEVSGG